MRDLARRQRLPALEFHAKIHGYEVDFLVVGTCVVLECDGWGVHALNRANWESDKVRDANLAAGGYLTLRFTYRQITRRPKQLADRIRAVLQRWTPDVLVANPRARP
jgi:very-short-patch-repair endonuclease